MTQLFKNNAASVLVGAIAAGDNVLSVANGDLFPTPTTGEFFLLTLAKLDNNGNEFEWEIVKVTARTGGALTVERSQEGTVAQSWADGTRAEARVTAASLGEIKAADASKLGGQVPAYYTPTRHTLLKTNTSAPAWVKSGSALITSQAITYSIAGVAHDIAASVAITLPALTAGSDYAIYATTDGRLLADLNWSAPAGEPAGTTRKLGGFHVALTGEISAYSLWDLNYRPSCPDPRGMVCINGMFWADIYLLGVNHHVDGTSRANVTIADGASPPKIPTIYNGNGSTAYPDLTWFVAQDVLQSHGKRCPSWAEFSMLAFGVSEGESVGADPVTTKHDAPRRSRWGIEQATGNLWVWGADNAGITGETAAASWQAITGGRGSVYVATVRAVLLGASWDGAGYSGSRSAYWYSSPSVSHGSIGVRGLSDHLTLLAER